MASFSALSILLKLKKVSVVLVTTMDKNISPMTCNIVLRYRNVTIAFCIRLIEIFTTFNEEYLYSVVSISLRV